MFSALKWALGGVGAMALLLAGSALGPWMHPPELQ